MKIKEVEELLNVSRANIRFYEKEGLFSPKRENNNYRDYSDEDVKALKKIILFRKLGFTIEEIKKLQSGEITLQDASKENVIRLEKEIEKLNGALSLTQKIAEEQTDFCTLDETHYLEILTEEENNGQEFVDILKDYLGFELNSFDIMWKWVFFHNFKISRQKHGALKAMGILLLLCVLRGIGRKFIWHGTFWEGFLYPFALFLSVSIILFPLYILSKKAPRVASFIADIIVIAGLIFLGGIILLIAVLLLNKAFHFWY